MGVPDSRAVRLRASLAAIQATTGSMTFTLSFGVVDSTMAQSFEDLLRIADAAHYRSKDGGRDRGTIGNPAMIVSGPTRHETEHHAQVNLRLLANDNR